MIRYGYSAPMATGVIAAGGTLGILIPPSIALVFYGIITETDIGQLFIAGVVPGLIGILMYCMTIICISYLKADSCPSGEKMSFRERFAAIRQLWAFTALVAIVLGGIYLGFFSPTESAAVGVVGAITLTFIRGKFKAKRIKEALEDSAATTVSLIAILIGSLIFANLVNVSNFPYLIVDWIDSLGFGLLGVLFIIICIYLVLGAVLESISMLLLTVPVFYPVVSSMGMDLIWFGIVVVVATEISLITPPVGLNVFVLKSVLPEVELKTIFKGVIPFVVADLIRLALIVLVPSLSLMLVT